MRTSVLTSLLALGASVAAAPAPVSLPLPNGFPNIANPSAPLSAIEVQAHGTLPNQPLPAKLAAADVGSFKLIAFNELFEVSYFSTLLQAVQSNAAGFVIADATERATVIAAITAIVAQEELHALLANTVLQKYGAAPIQPCKYIFPPADFASAIALAATFTDVVVGTLGAAAQALGVNGDSGLIPGIAAVIGQESQQTGFFRTLGGKIPSELPFLTGSTPEFAYSALNQNFIVAGSCPNQNTIPIPVFKPLKLVTPAPVAAKTQTLTMSFTGTASECSGYNVAYINQQNIPVVEPLTNIKEVSGVVTFDVLLPYDQYLMNGLTIVSVVKGSGFTLPSDVAAAAIYGPALLEL